jgi:hypothetical protein
MSDCIRKDELHQTTHHDELEQLKAYECYNCSTDVSQDAIDSGYSVYLNEDMVFCSSQCQFCFAGCDDDRSIDNEDLL